MALYCTKSHESKNNGKIEKQNKVNNYGKHRIPTWI